MSLNEDKIYFSKELNQLPNYYNRDLIKVLFVNPKTIFLLWGISSNTYKKLENDFNTSSEKIQFELLIHFKDENKKNHTKKISLPPFSTNWFHDFKELVSEVKAEISAYINFGNSISILQSYQISIPSKKPSHQISHDWIHPAWLEFSKTETKSGETYLIPKENFQDNNSEYKSNETNPFFENKIFQSDGNSGFLSSGNKK